jgi:hypothetical protein
MDDQESPAEAEEALLRLPAFRVDPMTGIAEFEAGGDPTACAVFVESLSARCSTTRHPVAAALRDLKYRAVTAWMDENCVSAMQSTKTICKEVCGLDLDETELDSRTKKNIRTMINGFIKDYDKELQGLSKNPKKIIGRAVEAGSNEKSYKIVPAHYVEREDQ